MPGRSWNEASLSENPAVEQLVELGYTYVEPETLEAERESLKDVVLTKRLAAAIARLNPWLSDDNVQKAVRAVTHVAATSLIDASEKLHPNHTREFWAALGRVMPDYDARKARLRAMGPRFDW